MSAASLSSQLVERIAAFRLDDVPRATRERAKLVLLDTLGEALAAARIAHPATRGPARLLARSARSGEASVFGSGARAPAADAAFCNATLAAFGLLDPIHAATTMHSPATAMAAAFALCEREKGDGRRLLGAFLLGVEVACRVSAALGSASLYERGFHPTAVCGAFGAAAAAGHALRLDRLALAAALGLAFQQAGGALAWTTDASESARPLSPAIGARNGCSAALLASAGLGGPPAPFDGKLSAFVAFSGAGEPKALLAGWGERFFVDEVSHKLHASCSYTHAALDALLALRRRRDVAAAQVRAIEVRIVPSTRALVADPGLRSCHMPYVIAIGLLRGRVAIGDIVEDRSAEPEVARLMRCTTLVDDPALEAGYPGRCGAAIEIRLADGASLRDAVDAARGTPANPLGEGEVREKFRAAAGSANALADRIMRIETLPDLAALAAALRDARATSRNQGDETCPTPKSSRPRSTSRGRRSRTRR